MKQVAVDWCPFTNSIYVVLLMFNNYSTVLTKTKTARGPLNAKYYSLEHRACTLFAL